MMEALLLAIVDKRVVLIEEWEGSPSTGKHPLSDYLEPNLINWKPNPPEKGKVTDFLTFKDHYGSGRTQDQKFVKKLPCKFHLESKGVRFTGNLLTDTDYLQFPGCEPYFPSDASPKVYADLFWSLFRFTQLVHDDADRLRGEILPAHRNFYIAAHVRTGGMFDGQKDELRSSTENIHKKFIVCINTVTEAIQKRCGGDAPWTYLASDNKDAKTYIRQHVGKEVRLQAPDVEVMHIDLHKDDEQKQQPLDEETATSSYRSVLAEFKILLDSSCLITSDSGFSRMAKILTRKDRAKCQIAYDRCDEPEKVKKVTENVPCH
jgi:hypothetical protein